MGNQLTCPPFIIQKCNTEIQYVGRNAVQQSVAPNRWPKRLFNKVWPQIVGRKCCSTKCGPKSLAENVAQQSVAPNRCFNPLTFMPKMPYRNPVRLIDEFCSDAPKDHTQIQYDSLMHSVLMLQKTIEKSSHILSTPHHSLSTPQHNLSTLQHSLSTP